jgi:hypothetical protein
VDEIQRNIIFIQGGKYTDIKKILRQWIDLYSTQLEENYTFKLYKNGTGNHVIEIHERLDNELFYFLVNYLQYPVGVDCKVKVTGYTKGTEQNALKGKDLLVFIPETDTEYDNVYVVTETNENYRVEFGGNIIEGSETHLYQNPVFIPTTAPEIVEIKRNNKREDSLKDERSIENRLNWMFILIIILHVFNFLIIRPFSVDSTISFENVPFLLSVGISIWLFWDYKLLQNNTRYLKCLGLVSIILISIFLFAKMGMLHVSKEKMASAIFPLILLIFQWPLRYVFIQINSREPIVENHPRSFTNGLYTIVLLVVPVAITLILTGMI